MINIFYFSKKKDFMGFYLKMFNFSIDDLDF